MLFVFRRLFYIGLVKTSQVIKKNSNSPSCQIGRFSYIQLVFTFSFHNLIIRFFIN